LHQIIHTRFDKPRRIRRRNRMRSTIDFAAILTSIRQCRAMVSCSAHCNTKRVRASRLPARICEFTPGSSSGKRFSIASEAAGGREHDDCSIFELGYYDLENLESFSMKSNVATLNRKDTALETFAAELTDAAFPVALAHGVGNDWLDVKLELWRALDRAVKKLTPDLCEARASF
jgi:hypothetical protein